MATEAEWFRVLIQGFLESPTRRAWAEDLLALGPHGSWVEPEPWAAILASEVPVLGEPYVYEAGSYVVCDGMISRVYTGAGYLMGIVDTLQDARAQFRPNPKIVYEVKYADVLPVLWARSGNDIAEAFFSKDVKTDRLFYVAANLDPDVVDILIDNIDLSWIDRTNSYPEYDFLSSDDPQARANGAEVLLTSVEMNDPDMTEFFRDIFRPRLSALFENEVLRR